MSGRSIWSFTYLKYQNLSTSDDFIYSSGFQFHFWPPQRQWHYLKMILSCWGDQYGHFYTSNTKICPLVMIYLYEWNNFLVSFKPPRRHWCHLQMILSFRRDQYGCLDTLNIKIRPLFQKIQAEPGWCNNFRGGGTEEEQRRNGGTERKSRVVLGDRMMENQGN